jgi:hypothetical protein
MQMPMLAWHLRSFKYLSRLLLDAVATQSCICVVAKLAHCSDRSVSKKKTLVSLIRQSQASRQTKAS